MNWLAKGIVSLLLLQACCSGHQSTKKSSLVFTDHPVLQAPIRIYVERFKYSSQLLPTKVAVNYLHYEIDCDLFVMVDDIYQADVIVADRQKVDELTGEFLLPLHEGKVVLGDAGPKKLDGRTVYLIRVYGQHDLERQARLLSHELLHVLKIDHDSIEGSIMNPRLVKDRDVIIPDNTLKTLRRLYCQ